MLERRCQASSGGHFVLPNSYIHPTKLCSGQPQHLCKSAIVGPSAGSPRDPPPCGPSCCLCHFQVASTSKEESFGGHWHALWSHGITATISECAQNVHFGLRIMGHQHDHAHFFTLFVCIVTISTGVTPVLLVVVLVAMWTGVSGRIGSMCPRM